MVLGSFPCRTSKDIHSNSACPRLHIPPGGERRWRDSWNPPTAPCQCWGLYLLLSSPPCYWPSFIEKDYKEQERRKSLSWQYSLKPMKQENIVQKPHNWSPCIFTSVYSFFLNILGFFKIFYLLIYLVSCTRS